MITSLIAAFLPFLVLFGLLLYGKKSILTASIWTVVVTIVLLLSVWGVLYSALFSAFFKAVFVSFDILLILVGATVFMTVFKVSGALPIIHNFFLWISPDKRIQAILVAFFFVGFIEGLAGFGTPAMLAVPLLLLLGFPTKTAIVLALLGGTIFVPFGAVGTPIIIGVSQGFEGLLGLGTENLSATIVRIIAPLVMLMPLILSCTTTYFLDKDWKNGLEIWKQALVAGILLVVPYVAVAFEMGPEFPSIISSVVGGFLFVFYLRLLSSRSKVESNEQMRTSKLKSSIQGWHIFVPYLVTAVVLIISRIQGLPIKELLQNNLVWNVDKIFALQVEHVVQPLYSPGFFLIIGSLVAAWLFGVSPQSMITISHRTLKKLLRPAVTLFLLILFTQLLLFSHINTEQQLSTPIFIASLTVEIPILWSLTSPFVGLLGAASTGSATVSNLLFSSFQAHVAKIQQLDVQTILALQVVGAAVGNMIALHNITAVLAVTDGKEKEHSILAVLLKPTMLLATIVGLMGTLVLLFD